MNTRLGEGNVVRTAKRILGFAGLACLALVCAGADYAQSKPTPAGPAAGRPVAAAPESSPSRQPSSTTQGATQTLAQTPAKPAAPKGQSEGIKVHGHWTIEVKNPDGTVATHREFENSLTQPFGANFLQNLLLGIYTPEFYSVQLQGTNADQTPASQPSPCGGGACLIGENLKVCASGVYVCTLTRTPALGVAANGPPGQAITFQGTIPAVQPGYIGVVRLFMQICANTQANTQSPVSPLDCSGGNNGLPGDSVVTFFNPLTSAILAAPVQITAAGQTVSVTVALSFQ